MTLLRLPHLSFVLVGTFRAQLQKDSHMMNLMSKVQAGREDFWPYALKCTVKHTLKLITETDFSLMIYIKGKVEEQTHIIFKWALNIE